MFSIAVIAAVMGTTELALELLDHLDHKHVDGNPRSSGTNGASGTHP